MKVFTGKTSKKKSKWKIVLDWTIIIVFILISIFAFASCVLVKMPAFGTAP